MKSEKTHWDCGSQEPARSMTLIGFIHLLVQGETKSNYAQRKMSLLLSLPSVLPLRFLSSEHCENLGPLYYFKKTEIIKMFRVNSYLN